MIDCHQKIVNLANCCNFRPCKCQWFHCVTFIAVHSVRGNSNPLHIAEP